MTSLFFPEVTFCAVGLVIFFPVTDVTGNIMEWHNNDMDLNLLDASFFASNRTQNGRIFQFSKEETAIRVEIGFAIPFLSIPLSKKADSDQPNYLVYVNLGALAAAGVFSLTSLLFIPKLFTGLSPQASLGRSDEGQLSGVLSRISDVLLEHDIDTAICTQRAVCWLVSLAVSNVNGGQGGSIDKIVDGISSNEWVEQKLKGTSLQQAMDNGRKGHDCSVLYSQCPLSQETITNASKQIMAHMKSSL